jgi:hypothetical protein
MQVGVEQNRLVLPLVVHSPAVRRALWHHCGPGRGAGGTTGTRTGVRGAGRTGVRGAGGTTGTRTGGRGGTGGLGGTCGGA